MLFNKPFLNLEYSDIEDLKNKRIDESLILDYKDMRIDNKNVVKEVTAFSNTGGGYLIYGVKETKGGGPPESIDGIDENINLEQLEHLINGNVRPRINVLIKKIEIPHLDEKIILIIHIPEGQNKPYYNNITNKFYKRYNFEAKEMDEHEIESLYQQRFFGASKLSKYVDEAILFKRSKLQEAYKKIDGHIIITPLRINDRIIDISENGQIDFDINTIRLEPKPEDLYLNGISKPSRYGIQWSDKYLDNNIEIHRNGLVHYMKNYGDFDDNRRKLRVWDSEFARNLIETIQFADIVYSKFDYIGKVKIIIKVLNTFNSEIMPGRPMFGFTSSNTCDAEQIYVEKEWDSWRLKEDYLEIGKSIMDEFNNYYGLWNSRHFREEGGTVKYSREE